MKFKVGDKVEYHSIPGRHGTVTNLYKWCGIELVSVRWDNTVSALDYPENDLKLISPGNAQTTPRAQVNTIAAHFGMNASGAWFDPIYGEGFSVKLKEKSCECGTKNVTGQGHSHWCPIYNKEF